MIRLFSRLGFVFLSLGVSLSLGACAADTADEDFASGDSAIETNAAVPTGLRLRVVAGNLTSGTKQSWDPGHGARMLKGIGADVAVLQEFNYGANTDADYKKFLSIAFDPSFSYTVERGVQIPNGIVSRYPIVAQGVWRDPQVGNRSFVWARIDVPGDKDLWAVSLHLLTSSAAKRQAEATALVAQIKSVVPESDYLVIGGDFNTGSRTEACLQTLGAITRTTGPWPTDSKNNGGTNASRGKPYDWLIADPDLHARATPVTFGNMTFKNGLVFDSREFPDLRAVEPTQKGDSAASNMQHMAIVRDFALPN